MTHKSHIQKECLEVFFLDASPYRNAGGMTVCNTIDNTGIFELTEGLFETSTFLLTIYLRVLYFITNECRYFGKDLG